MVKSIEVFNTKVLIIETISQKQPNDKKGTNKPTIIEYIFDLKSKVDNRQNKYEASHINEAKVKLFSKVGHKQKTKIG